MEYFAAIDVSLELSSVCVVDGTGRIVREAKVASEPDALVGYLRESGLVLTRVGLEAGPLSQWLGRNHAGCGRDGAGEAELGDLAREVMRLSLGGALVEVVGPEVLVDGAVAQHVPDGGQHGGGDGADRLLRAAALAQALELRPEIAILFATSSPGALDEDGLQPRRALA